MTRKNTSIGLMTLGLLSMACTCGAIDLMQGKMVAVPVPHPGRVKIDGDLSDWDLSGQEWFCISPETADKFHGTAALMYDDDALYLAAKVSLPGRPYRNVNSASEKPWEGEDIEFRLISTPDAPKPWAVPKDYKGPLAEHVVTCMFWLNSVTQKTNLKVTYGPFHDGGVVDNPAGAEVAYKQFAHPYYYTMEARLPWSLLHAKGGKNPFQRGQSMTAFLTVMWGQSGQQRMEGLETAPTGNFGWSWWSIQHWGQVEFSAQGHLPPRHESLEQYLAEKVARPVGTPFTIELPRPLKASVSIVGSDGQIVRELIGGEPRPQGKSTVYWDGYDWMGHRMPPGKYAWKAYASPGLKLKFMGSVGTSGQPPYNTTDGKGGWGADFGAPIDVACDDTGTYFLWDTSEGGRSIVKITADGQTAWRNTPFVLSGGYGPHLACATNGKFLYVVSGQPKTFLSRFQADNGLAAPFPGTAYPVINEPDGGKKPAEEGATDFKHGKPTPETIGLAATAGEVFAGAYSKGKVLVLDADTGKKTRELACPFPRGICLDQQGDLYAISCDVKSGNGGRVLKFAKAAGPGSPVMRLDGLKTPWGIAVDASGQIYVSEAGFSNQVWVYSAGGKPVARIGKAGGRPWGGRYQADNLLFPTGLATDGNGSLLVAQASIPKVFSRYRIEPLQLEQQWFGDCDYAPSGWGDARDPRTVYCSMGSGFIRATVKGDGSDAYPDGYWDFEMMGYPQAFWGFGNTMQIPDNFIGPHGIQFMYAGATEGPKAADGILRVEGDRMIPVGYVRNLGRAQATKDGPAEPFGLELWSDLNHNGKVEPNELMTVRELCGESIDTPKHAFLHLKGTLWMDRQCNLYLANFMNRIYRIPAKSVDDRGAIVWDPAGATIVARSIIPNLEFTGEDYRTGLQGMGRDDRGNLFLAFGASRWQYASPAWTKAMNEGLGHAGGINLVKIAKFDPQGKRLWMAGRKARAIAKPGEMYHHWTLAGLAGDAYPAVASEMGPFTFYTPDGFFVDALLEDPNKGGELGPYAIGGGESFTGRVQWYPERGECWLYTGQTAGLAYQVLGFDRRGRVEGEMRFSGQMQMNVAVDPFPAKGELRQITEIIPLSNPLATGRWGDKRETIEDAARAPLAAVSVGYDARNLYARFVVKKAKAFENRADTETLAFKQGDCVGLYLGKPGKREKPQLGDIRLLATVLGGKPVVVAMIPVSRRLHRPFEYYTPAGGRQKFAFVGVLQEATARIQKTAEGYTVEMAVPLAAFEELRFRPGEKLALEAEVLVSGSGQRGFQTLSRNHLYTPRDAGAPNMVDDIPSEARLYPQYWGEAVVK